MSLLRSPIVQKPYKLFHYYFLSEKRPGNTLADLSFETNPKHTISQFFNRSWSYREIVHYSFLSSVIFFVFIIFPANFFIKLLILSAFVTCFVIPLTSQFFVHALPIFTWLALFFSAGKIPTSWKPAILVKVLPAMETILYGDNLSNVLATITLTLLDVVAWLPYGLLHFSAPFVVAAFIFVFAPPTSLRSYGFAFGYMNLLGVMIQILFPAAPPWYKNKHGLEPANYSMSGSPGGLGRIDELLGFDMYTSTFSNSPVVFGAFPSLHSGCSVMDVLFLCWLFPKYTIVWWGYASWLWWSTMYLTHHYFIDLIGGAALSFIVFNYTKYMHLPVVNHKLFCRWSYTQIERIDIVNSDPLLNYGVNYSGHAEDIEMGSLNNGTNNAPAGANFSYFYNKSVSNDLPRLGSRSRQHSRSDLAVEPVAAGSRLRSTSSLNLAPHEEEQSNDVETFSQSSVEHSAVPSVFDGENYTNGRNISSNASNSLLDELIEEPAATNTKLGRSR